MRPTRCSPALLLAISTAAVAVLLAGDTAGWSITVEAMKPPSTRDRLQRFLNGSSIVDVDMQPPRAEASGSPNHLLKRTVSAAVEEKLKDAEVRVSDLEARPTLTVAGFARQIQLLTLVGSMLCLWMLGISVSYCAPHFYVQTSFDGSR